jgi:hypothetical protein
MKEKGFFRTLFYKQGKQFWQYAKDQPCAGTTVKNCVLQLFISVLTIIVSTGTLIMILIGNDIFV